MDWRSHITRNPNVMAGKPVWPGVRLLKYTFTFG